MPRIEHITITPIAFREPPLLAASGIHQPWAIRCIIEMHVEGGIVGLGESYGDRTTLMGLEVAAKRLIGHDATNLNRIARASSEAATEIDPLLAIRGTSMPTPHAELELRLAGGIEVAALDAWGKSTGMRLCDILGGQVREKVPYAAYLFYRFGHHIGFENEEDEWGEALTPEAVVEQAGQMIEKFGFQSMKLKGGVFAPEVDVETLNALSEAFPGIPLRVDPNTNWSEETTEALIPLLLGKLEYLEDPVAGMDAMARIQAKSDIPLSTNMCVTRLEHLPEAISKNVVKVILADHHSWGGVSKTMHLAQCCTTWGIGLSMHSNSHLGISLAAMTHIGAAIPGPIYSFDTHYCWEKEDVIEGGLIEFEDGSLGVPEGPGLGVAIDQDMLKRMAKNYANLEFEYRDDASEMLKYWPDWQAGVMPKF